jgi:hypothetical protein
MRKYQTYLCSDVQQEVLARAMISMKFGHFFEAHELLEELFRACLGDGRLLFHGLAQIAAAHHQLTIGRARAAIRTWNKARLKLAGIGMLDPDFARAMDAFYAGLGIDLEGPRFIEPTRLAPPQSFPVPLEDRDQTPSA